MASKVHSALAGLGGAERFACNALRIVTDVVHAVGEGMRARNEYRERVGHGDDPALAIASAVRHAEMT